LYSFAGRPVCPMRHRMMAIGHERGLIEDTTGYNYFTGSLDERLKQQQERYAQTIARSQFVLCPRGIATSSYRAYEAMAAARVPVIISDEWVRPTGPDWDSFAVFVREDEVERFLAMLEAMEDEAEQRGIAARQAYDQWFGPSVMIDWCGEILETRRVPERLVRLVPDRQLNAHRMHEVRQSLKRIAKRTLKRAALSPSHA